MNLSLFQNEIRILKCVYFSDSYTCLRSPDTLNLYPLGPQLAFIETRTTLPEMNFVVLYE